MSVSRIWASRRSPRPVSAECFKDLLPRRCPGDLRRPVFDGCFKDLGLPEISAARFCRAFQGFAAPALHRRSPEVRFDECFKDSALPEISAARFCRVFQRFAAPALLRRSPEARF